MTAPANQADSAARRVAAAVEAALLRQESGQPDAADVQTAAAEAGADPHAELGTPGLRLLAAVAIVAAAAACSALWPWGWALPLP